MIMKKKIITILSLVLGLSGLVACNKVADNTEHLTEITSTLKLNKSYEGKNFLTDGIGKATVETYTDGDTTKFKLNDGSSIIIRYYEIDTPESTSSVEKWGKAASTFNKQQLSQATEIVLESSTGTIPEKDKYGTRYLGYVWYKCSENEDFKLLNLEECENGYTKNKGIDTDAYPYYSYFNKAEKNAKKIQLRVWSELDDPLYTTDPTNTTIKEILSNPDAFYNSDTESGLLVCIEAYLSSLYCSDSGTYTFTAEQVDKDTGETKYIKIYAGYASSSSSTMKIGQLYRIVGNVDKWYENYQIKGLSYDDYYQLPELTYLTQSGYYLTFDSEVNYTINNNMNAYKDAVIKEVNVSNNDLIIVAEAEKIVKTGDGEVKEFTFTIKNAADKIDDVNVGDIFSTSAYQFVKKSGQLTVYDFAKLSFK